MGESFLLNERVADILLFNGKNRLLQYPPLC